MTMNNDCPVIIHTGLIAGNEVGPEAFDRRWVTARNRMLGYLDVTGFPPLEATALVVQILEETRIRMNVDNRINPVEYTMQSLRRVLFDQKRIDLACRLRKMAKEISLPSFPPLNIGHMIPQKLENRLFARLAAVLRMRWFIPSAGLLGLLVYFYLAA